MDYSKDKKFKAPCWKKYGRIGRNKILAILLIIWPLTLYIAVKKSYCPKGANFEDLNALHKIVLHSNLGKDMDTYLQKQDEALRDPSIPMPGVCSQGIRLQALQAACPKQHNYTDLDKISKHDLKKLVKGIKVLDKFEMLACISGKAASQILTVLFLNNTSHHPITHPFNWKHVAQNHTIAHKYRPLDQYSHTEIQYRLQHYYKMMAVRHPLERLSIVFTDHLVLNKNKAYLYQPKLVKTILSKVKPDKDKNYKLQFSDFLKFVIEGGSLNDLTDPYFSKCFPCFINYDFILKTETFENDIRFLVQKKLAGRWIHNEYNNRHDRMDRSRLPYVRILDLYKDIDLDLFKKIANAVLQDDRLFQYGYIRDKSGTLYTKCTAKDEEGNRCC